MMSAEVVNHNSIDDELAKEAFNNGFLDYGNTENPRNSEIELFYYNNHTNMTVDYVLNQRKTICKLEKAKMTLWDALMLLNDIIDDSDPDTSATQLIHAIQTAEVCIISYHNSLFVINLFNRDVESYIPIRIGCIWLASFMIVENFFVILKDTICHHGQLMETHFLLVVTGPNRVYIEISLMIIQTPRILTTILCMECILPTVDLIM